MAEWISVKDRLPEEAVDVLVFDNNGKITMDFYYINGFYNETEYSKATHWMPLPKPPKGE